MTNPPSASFAAEPSPEPPEAALAAHDIKNLLAAVIGHADLQLQAVRQGHIGGESSRARDLCSSLDAIRLSAAHAMTLCEEMLALADGRPPQLCPVDLGTLAAAAVELFRTRVGDVVQVHTDGPAALSVQGHRTDLQRTLLNLMWNAFDAMDGQADKRILVRWGEEEGSAFVEVVDCGPGLPAGHLADLTRPFRSSKHGEGKIRGLGLHAAARVMRRHGGRLLGRNRSDGDGAVLRLQFGLAPELDFDAPQEGVPASVETRHQTVPRDAGAPLEQ